MKKNNKINMEGKIAIKLEENEYVIRENILAVVRNGHLRIYEIKEKLSQQDLRILEKNRKYGIERIENKLRKSSPLTITNGNIYYDDMVIIKAENKVAYIAIF